MILGLHQLIRAQRICEQPGEIRCPSLDWEGRRGTIGAFQGSTVHDLHRANEDAARRLSSIDPVDFQYARFGVSRDITQARVDLNTTTNVRATRAHLDGLLATQNELGPRLFDAQRACWPLDVGLSRFSTSLDASRARVAFLGETKQTVGLLRR